MSISFNQIPSNTRKPLMYVEVDNSKANLYSQSLRTLLFAQTINVAEAVPTFIGSVSQAIELFGLGSQAHLMADSYFQNNQQNELWIVPLADESGSTKSETDLQVTEGTLTQPKTAYLNISGETVEVNLESGSTAIGQATAIESAINANVLLPVTATRTTDTVSIIAKNAGTLGNDLPISVSGIASTLTMTSGTGDPVITSTIVDSIGDVAYEYWVSPYTDDNRVDQLTAILDERWNPIKGLYGHLFIAKNDSVANLKVLGERPNNEHLTVIGINGTRTSTIETLSAYVGQVAQSLSIDPALPLQTLELAGVKPVLPQDEFNYAEQTALLYSGVSPLTYESNKPAIVRCITTYRLNSFGSPDVSYLDVTTLSTLARVIRQLKGVVTSRFARVKLVNNGTLIGAGSATVSPAVIRNELISVYDDLIALGLVENSEAFEENLVVERSQTDPNRVDILFTPDLVNQLRVFAVKTQFVLQFNQ